MEKENSEINTVSETRCFLAGSSQSVTGKREFELLPCAIAFVIVCSVSKVD